MSILQLTLPNLIGYALSFSALLLGVYHLCAQWFLRRSIAGFDRQFDKKFNDELLSWGELNYPHPHLRKQVIRLTAANPIAHPMADIVLQLFDAPHLWESDLVMSSAIARTSDRLFGGLISRIELNRLIAPMLGLGSTVMGIIIGAREYAASMDPGILMHSISLAMICTLCGCATVILESVNVTFLQRIEVQMAEQMFDLLGRLREALREDGRRQVERRKWEQAQVVARTRQTPRAPMNDIRLGSAFPSSPGTIATTASGNDAPTHAVQTEKEAIRHA